MENRRAIFRNMRSKCRCSCVLQFTRHLGVSSVLHRPLSQIIHCIVLYLGFQTFSRPECWERDRVSLSANNWQLDSPSRGRSQLRPAEGRLRGETLNTVSVCTRRAGLSHSQIAGPTNLSVSQPEAVLSELSDRTTC